MNQMIVAVFDSESAAREGMRAMRDLHREGGISLYASALIVKDKAGKVSVKQEADEGPVGTALGMLAGSLVGLLGGPAGLAAGASLGALAGMLFDLDKAGVDLTFLDDALDGLTPGKAAVLAEVEESWTSLLDERLREHGGKVYRRFRADVVDDQIVREEAAFDANLSALRDDLANSASEDRAAIQKDIEKVKKQIQAARDRATARLDQLKAETTAKTKALQDQAREAGGRAKGRVEKRISEVRADFEVRSKKLNQALKLAKEALAA
jgi:uncharacterized membrane protein